MSSKQTPLVSIAMCTYNGEKYLREQLDSLINQDYKNYELIIVDDCSTDSTFSILKEYAEKYSYIELHLNTTNLGFKRNFEKALSLVKGEFIALCDQDDIWFPNKVSTCLKHISNHSLAYCAVELIDKKGQKLDEEFPSVNLLEGKCHLSLLFGNCVTGHASMIRKSLLRHALPIPPGINLHDHWVAFVAASLQGIKKIPKPLSLYRKHDKNAVFRKNKNHKNSKLSRRIASYEVRLAFLTEASKISSLEKEDAEYIHNIAIAYSKYKKTITNNTLSHLLRQKKETLALYKKPQAARRKICRGLILDLL
jgi:glycosyltransferase involved in cell wall biosynthesis